MKKEDFVSLGVGEEAAEKAAEKYQAALDSVKLDYAVNAAIEKAGGKNARAIRALIDFDKIALGGDGEASGLDEQIEALKSDPRSDFMFAAGDGKGFVLKGAVTGESGREIPDGRVDFTKLSYGELCAILESNPRIKLN